MTKGKSAAPLRVEKGVLVEQQREGLLLKVPVFVINSEPRPDLAGFMRGRGSIGLAEMPWTMEDHEGGRTALLHISPSAGARPFTIAFPLDMWSGLLTAAANAGELGVMLDTYAELLPTQPQAPTLWLRGTNEMLRALLEAEN